MDEAQNIQREELASEFELRDVLIMLRRRWLLVLAAWAAVLLVTAFFVFSTTPQYKATCKLLVEATATAGTSQMASMPGSELMQQARARTIENQLELLESGTVLRKALDELELPTSPSPISNFYAEAIKNADVIYLRVESTQPEVAASVANKMGEVYVKLTQEQSRQAAGQARDFIQSQLTSVQADLNKAEQDLVAFQKDQKLYVIDGQAAAMSNRLLAYEQAAAEADLAAKSASARQQAAYTELKKRPEFARYSKTTQLNPISEQLKGNLVTLEIKRAELLAELTEKDPRVKALDARIADSKLRLKEEASRIENAITEQYNPVVASLNSDWVNQEIAIAEQSAKSQGLRRLMQLTEGSLKHLPDREIELARLQRNLTVTEGIYTTLLGQLQNYRLAEAMAVPKATVIDNAGVPEYPFKPKTVLSFALAFAMGLIFGLALAVIVERMDDTLRDPKDIETKLGLSILGVIPLAERDEPVLVTETSPRSALSEAYRTLRSNVRFTAAAGTQREEGVGHLMVVTSSTASEGKSSVAFNLAVVTAQLGQRVILVDSDLRRPTAHRLLGVDSSKGLTTALLGDVPVEELVQPTSIEGLAFLPSGPLPPNPAELIDSVGMRNLLDTLRGMAEVIILDSPPVAVVTDSQLLAAQSDGVLLVIASGETRLGLAKRAKELLDRAGARFYGAVANKVDARREGYYYYYYYYYYGYTGEEK